MPRLIVMRHATAGGSFGTADSDRALTGRGQRAAEAAAAWLRAAGAVPDHIVCSPATRARQTLDRLALDTPAVFEPRVYRNDVDLLFDLIHETRQEAKTLLLVGHNPSAHGLVLELTAGTEPRDFPAGALSVVDWRDGWPDAGPGRGTLVAVWTPVGRRLTAEA